MSEEGGNGDGDFVTRDTLRTYQNNQTMLCASYRKHIESEIVTMEKNITSKIQLVGAVLGIIVTILTAINVYLSVIM